MIVAPGTAASAAASAFWSWVPVRRVSSGPCVMVAGFVGAPLGGAPLEFPAGAVDPEPELEPELLVAAEAIPAAPTPAPVTRAPVTRMLRTIEERLAMEIPLCIAPGASRMRPPHSSPRLWVHPGSKQGA